MSNVINVFNREDETPYGFDVTGEGERVWYFVRGDLFGDGRCYAIWNPEKRLCCYKSFKEAIIYLAIVEKSPIFSVSKYHIVRSFQEFDYKNIEIIHTKKEEEYYSLD